MAIRIETLRAGKRAPRAAWIMLFAVVVVAAAFATGTYSGRTEGSRSQRARPTMEQPPRSSRRHTFQDS